MSSKLDQSLEEIAGARRTSARQNRRGKPAPRVSGGVTKSTTNNKPSRAPGKTAAAPVPALPNSGESKIIVSNLPSDVTEQQIKDYFTQSVGAVKKVMLNYNKTGRSQGVATITFQLPTSAAEAAKTYDGVKVDNRPMKIEVILGAKHVPAPAPRKGLGERIAQPKKETAKPKSAAAPKPAAAANNGTASTRGKGRGGRRGGGRAAGRPKPKSVEELDAEMSEYFDPAAPSGQTSTTATNGAASAAAPAPAGGDAAMEDEIM